MTKKSKRLRFHVLLIAVILGAGISATVVNYYSLNRDISDATMEDGISEHFISVHPTSNGLAKISLIHNRDLVVGNLSTKTTTTYINSDIGDDALTTIGSN